MNDQPKWLTGAQTVWGNLLPFIGFRTIAIDDDGIPIDPRSPDFDPHEEYIEQEVFCFAWLGKGFMIRL